MNIVRFIKKDKNIIAISILIGLIAAVISAFCTKTYSDTIQNGIANEVIRFHVLANSDSKEDQELKIKVRDSILNEYKEELSACENIYQTKKVINDNLEKIAECAERTIKNEGYDYNVKASLSVDKFPTKKYGDVVFPAGDYTALRIEIGEAKGRNWWCVMFPPLCFVDITHNEIPENDKQQLKNILTEEEYSIISSAENNTSIPVKIKFKIVELWQS